MSGTALSTIERIRAVQAAPTEEFRTLLRLGGLDPGTNLRFHDWSDLSFAGEDLRGADFTGARLVNCNFSGAVITGVRFGQAVRGEPTCAPPGVGGYRCARDRVRPTLICGRG
jgi:hypothetical protein